MPPTFTSAQILSLAPDAAAAKAGQGLATPRKWQTLGATAEALWGECKGSAKEPYQSKVDLNGPAFGCTCPSRKFPCKHGLALMLLYVAQPNAFTQTAPPVWVTTWLENRTKRAEKQAARKATPKKPPNKAAQVKRASEREAKVTAGIDDLERWLHDLLRQGLGWTQTQPPKFWEQTAARLVDAQAPGLARLVRDCSNVPHSGAGWQERLLEHLSRIQLLIDGYRQLDLLPAETQADIRTLIGWTQNQDEILAQPGVRDHWVMLGQRTETDDKLKVQSSWLWGLQSQRAALVLQFIVPGQTFDTSLLAGQVIEAELVFFPSAYPLRALVKTRHAPQPLATLAGYPTLQAATTAYGQALARLPWLERFPAVLNQVTPLALAGAWGVRDSAAHWWPLSPHFSAQWELLALSAGQPLTMFGEWNGKNFLPLSVWAEDRLVLV